MKSTINTYDKSIYLYLYIYILLYLYVLSYIQKTCFICIFAFFNWKKYMLLQWTYENEI